jgi:hypothetical protein
MKRFIFSAQIAMIGLLVIGFFGFGFRLMRIAEAAQEEKRACNPEAFISAMEEVLEVFPDPNAPLYIQLGNGIVFSHDDTIAIPNPKFSTDKVPFHIDLSTPAQKLRADVDARAKEIERKSQVLRNVQSLLSACKKSKP